MSDGFVIIGSAPTEEHKVYAESISKGRVHFIVKPETLVLQAAYSNSAFLLFPSIAEGFGWPIIEAMACGAVVLTTDDSPMLEVGGQVAFYLPKYDGLEFNLWAEKCADRILEIGSSDEGVLESKRVDGLNWAREFSCDKSFQQYIEIYSNVLAGRLA